MESEERIPERIDPKEVAWINLHRQQVINYLRNENCDHNGLSSTPRWYLYPLVALWSVRSKLNPDIVDGWAIAGNLPTDYLTATTENSTVDLLRAFADKWNADIIELTVASPPSPQEKEFATLLRRRIELLKVLATDIENGTLDGD